MDINNYNYTGPGFGRDDIQTIASYEDINGYITLTMEQWGSDRTQKRYVINGFINCENISVDFPCDYSGGWETARHTYGQAAAIYNKYVPDHETIALF